MMERPVRDAGGDRRLVRWSRGRLTILRPLRGFRRQELREYREEIGQAWREDASNASGRYLRSRVRHTLMPLVNVLWPRGVEAVGRAAALAGEAQGLIE